MADRPVDPRGATPPTDPDSGHENCLRVHTWIPIPASSAAAGRIVHDLADLIHSPAEWEALTEYFAVTSQLGFAHTLAATGYECASDCYGCVCDAAMARVEAARASQQENTRG